GICSRSLPPICIPD
nr:Chain C, SFMI1 - Sunflower MASP1 inhibitor [Helianthus annuus]